MAARSGLEQAAAAQTRGAAQTYYERFDRIDRVMQIAFLMTTFIGCATRGMRALSPTIHGRRLPGPRRFRDGGLIHASCAVVMIIVWPCTSCGLRRARSPQPASRDGLGDRLDGPQPQSHSTSGCTSSGSLGRARGACSTADHWE